MTDLTEFASLPLHELTAELERMQRTLAPFTPATAGTSRDVPEAPPLGRAVAGAFSTATCSGQATPLPADPAARGTYAEDRA